LRLEDRFALGLRLKIRMLRPPTAGSAGLYPPNNPESLKGFF